MKVAVSNRPVRYSYLPEQFADHELIWEKIRSVVQRGDYTLGREVWEFENEFAQRLKVNHAIGVNSGTDALFLSLKALGITGEVITTPYSFYATTATIVNAGARPVYAEVDEDFNISPEMIELAITKNTEAIVPVHWAGRPCDMTAIMDIAARHGLAVIEDAAHAFGAMWKGQACGTFGTLGAFSLHPQKTVNVWGDGGVIVTDYDDLAHKLRSLRNHGLAGRDTCGVWAYNSRLDTVQAVVASHIMDKSASIINRRRRIAKMLDAGLDGELVDWVDMPEQSYANYYIYTVKAWRRNELVAYLNANGIEAKIHYPVPLHLQPAAASLGYVQGSFPMAERLANETISFPAHEFVSDDDVGRMIGLVRAFYSMSKASKVWP